MCQMGQRFVDGRRAKDVTGGPCVAPVNLGCPDRDLMDVVFSYPSLDRGRAENKFTPAQTPLP